MTIFTQLFFDTQRPMYALGFAVQEHETFLHQFLPSSSFPSDHASVSASFAMIFAMLLRKKHYGRKILSVIFFVFCLVMGVSRVLIGVHRPLDIVAGIVIGIIAGIILGQPKVFTFFQTYVYKHLVSAQQHLFGFFSCIFGKKQ